MAFAVLWELFQWARDNKLRFKHQHVCVCVCLAYLLSLTHYQHQFFLFNLNRSLLTTARFHFFFG